MRIRYFSARMGDRQSETFWSALELSVDRSFVSTSLLLDHLGLTAESARVEAAVAADLAERGGRVRSTAEVGRELAARVAG